MLVGGGMGGRAGKNPQADSPRNKKPGAEGGAPCGGMVGGAGGLDAGLYLGLVNLMLRESMTWVETKNWTLN